MAAKAVSKMGTLLTAVSKKSGQPPVIHPPWNKARVRPMDAGDHGARERQEEKNERLAGKGRERLELVRTGNNAWERENSSERGRERPENQTRGKDKTNGLDNALIGPNGVWPEHRGQLPGLSSFGRSFGADHSMVIDGSYFQTSVEASRPPALRQKLSKSLGLISLTRRLQGPARVGTEQWRDDVSWDRGQEIHRKINGPIGDMTVSASVSERPRGDARRWGVDDQEEEVSSGGWWRRGKRFHDSDSETASGGKESPSEFSLSDDTSLGPSITTEQDKTESETETEKNQSDSGSDKEGDTPDRRKESESRGRTEEGEGSGSGSGLESDKEDKRAKRSASKSSTSSDSIRHKSAKTRSRKSSNSQTNKSNSRRSTASSSRPRRSRLKTSSRPIFSKDVSEEDSDELESEEEEESGEEEGRNVGSHKSLPRSRNKSSDINSGLVENSDDLSPILEDEEENDEEDEESSDQAGKGNGEDEEG